LNTTVQYDIMTCMRSTDLPARSYTARDVQQVAGLSYRNLNVWSARGALPGEDDARGVGWRRFSCAELFVLAVQVEIRRRFGVPVGRLRGLHGALLAGGADPLDEVAQLLADTGAGVSLVTDLDATTKLLPDAEVGSFIADRLGGGDAPAAILCVQVGPIAKRLVARLREDNIPTGVRALLDAPDDISPCTPAEAAVLRLIRSGDYRSIEVVMQDGEIKTLHTKRLRAGLTADEVADLIRDHDYQTLTLTTRAGRIVTVEQSEAHKPRS